MTFDRLKKRLKTNKWGVTAVIALLALLTAFFVLADSGKAGRAPTASFATVSSALTTQSSACAATSKQAVTVSSSPASTSTASTLPPVSTTSAAPIPASTQAVPSTTTTDRYQTDPVPEGKPQPVEPQEAVTKETVYTCTVSISCATILDNMELCDPEKQELIPADGWILAPVTVTFEEGESVFDMLLRVCRENAIHMEYSWTPIYNSAYIEGIHNLYEFDVGALSGWMYSVNDWFPNYGCSRYQLHDGDTVNWVYTCDYGYDVGGGYAVGS